MATNGKGNKQNKKNLDRVEKDLVEDDHDPEDLRLKIYNEVSEDLQRRFEPLMKKIQGLIEVGLEGQVKEIDSLRSKVMGLEGIVKKLEKTVLSYGDSQEEFGNELHSVMDDLHDLREDFESREKEIKSAPAKFKLPKIVASEASEEEIVEIDEEEDENEEEYEDGQEEEEEEIVEIDENEEDENEEEYEVDQEDEEEEIVEIDEDEEDEEEETVEIDEDEEDEEEEAPPLVKKEVYGRVREVKQDIDAYKAEGYDVEEVLRLFNEIKPMVEKEDLEAINDMIDHIYDLLEEMEEDVEIIDDDDTD